MKSLIAVCLSLVLLSGCVAPPSARRTTVHRRQAPQPIVCSATVPPITNSVLNVSIPVNFNYNPKDRPNGTQEVRSYVLNRLNALGKANGNTFYLQNGSQLNFTFTFSYSNNSEIFTGGMQFSGWAQGDIHYFSTSGQYNDPFQMAGDLTDQAYAFIAGGWHDLRPACAGR
jgi:hypothetical protein